MTRQENVFDDAYEALTDIRFNATTVHGFTPGEYDDIFVPRLGDLVKMVISKRRVPLAADLKIEAEFEVDWALFHDIVNENKPLDQRTLKFLRAHFIKEQGSGSGTVRHLNSLILD